MNWNWIANIDVTMERMTSFCFSKNLHFFSKILLAIGILMIYFYHTGKKKFFISLKLRIGKPNDVTSILI